MGSFDINKARSEFGVILKASVPSGFMYFRLPTKIEFDRYDELSKTDIPLLASSYLIDTTLLGTEPNNLDIYIGEMVNIGNLLAAKSGFQDIKQFQDLVAKYKLKYSDVGGLIIAQILKAFPGYKLKDVENMTAIEISKHLVLSEMIMAQPGQQQQEQPVPINNRTKELVNNLTAKDEAQIIKTREQAKEALNIVKKRG